MIIFLTLLMILAATAAIFSIKALVDKIKVSLHPNPAVNYWIKFQVSQMFLTAVVLWLAYLLNPVNFRTFFQVGDIYARISPLPWLGITGIESWLQIAFSMGFVISLVTAIFMYIQLRKAQVDFRYFWFSLLWAILFSITNAFAEESIFRLGVVSPLQGFLPVMAILLVSGMMFGIPHYFGQPGGIVGALMAAFLGWLLALSVLETQGLLIAWVIHCAQDIIIITSILMMSFKRSLVVEG